VKIWALPQSETSLRPPDHTVSLTCSIGPPKLLFSFESLPLQGGEEVSFRYNEVFVVSGLLPDIKCLSSLSPPVDE